MSYLPNIPSGGGFLPYWLLATSAASTYNSIQNYFILWQTKEVYGGKPHEMTPLAARIFSAWTFVTAVIRCTAAYHITDPTYYNLAIFTYIVAGAHFSSELLVFKTVNIGRGSLSVFAFATVSLLWTLSQRGYYLGL